MTRRQRIAAGFGALTHQDWVTVAICLVLLVAFVVSVVGLASGMGNVTK
jgi:hypothetical protein